MPIPKEHGAWAVLYAPLLTALLVADRVNLPLLWLLVAVTGLFLGHEPLARLARAGWPRTGLGGRAGSWWRWAALDLGLAALAGAILWLRFGLADLPWLGSAAGILLLVHLYRVGRRDERTVTGEIIGIAGLTLTLPGALYVLRGSWNADAFWLWLLHCLYFTGGIFYVKARVGAFAGRSDANRWALLSRVYHVVVTLGVGLAGAAGLFAPWASSAFIPALARALWAVDRPGAPLNMRRIGYSEVVVTVLFAVIVGIVWS